MSSLDRMRLPQILKHFLAISSGVAIGQILAFACMPIISRLYSPADFGVLGTATSLSGVIASVAALQYPQALVLPRRDLVAANMLAVSLACSLVTFLIISFFAVVVAFSGGSRLLLYPVLYWAVPILVLCAGVNQSLVAWCVRRKAFQRTAVSPIVRSLTLTGSQIGSGLSGTGVVGLVGGAVLGEGAANINLARQVFRDDWKVLIRSVRPSRMKVFAWRYRDIAGHATLQNLVSTVSISMPVFFFSYFGSIATTGYYSLAMRTLQVPMVLVISALRQVLLQRMAEHQHEKRPLADISRKSILSLMCITIPAGAAFFLVAPRLFTWVFGQKWQVTGEYARWLTPWIVSSFCNAPCLIAAQVLRLQKFLLNFEVVTLIARSVSLTIGLTCFSSSIAVGMLSITSTLLNVSLICLIYSKICQNDASFLSPAGEPA